MGPVFKILSSLLTPVVVDAPVPTVFILDFHIVLEHTPFSVKKSPFDSFYLQVLRQIVVILVKFLPMTMANSVHMCITSINLMERRDSIHEIFLHM